MGPIWIEGAAPEVKLCTIFLIRDNNNGRPCPTILIRVPYGKNFVEMAAWAIAAQGFNVIVQDCRGRFDSTGMQTFGAFEDHDGAAVLEWLAKQGFPWYDPQRVGMWGISYLGLVQWAAVQGAAQKQLEVGTSLPQLAPKAITPLMAGSRVFDVMFCGGSWNLDFYMRYTMIMTHWNSNRSFPYLFYFVPKYEWNWRQWVTKCLGMRRLHRKMRVPFLFKYNPRPQSKFWMNRDYSEALALAPPSLIASGWYDLFLECSLKDYEAVVKAKGPGHARLLIGPWHHFESFFTLKALHILMKETLRFLWDQLEGQADNGSAHSNAPVRSSFPPLSREKPVKLWVMGKRASLGEWRCFESWPPPADEWLFILGANKVMWHSESGDTDGSFGGASPSSSSTFTYDPLNPTPSYGGNTFDMFLAGERRQNALEERTDLLIFDTEVLEDDLTVIGRPRVRLVFRASNPYLDVIARICDVHPNGDSFNITEGVIRRAQPMDRARSHQEMHRLTARAGLLDHQAWPLIDLEVTLAGTAKCFKRGHKIRLIISGSAYPRLARNFGDAGQSVEDDPLDIEGCTFEVQHGGSLPSALFLPTVAKELETPRVKRSLHDAAARRVSYEGVKRHIELSAQMRRVQSEVTVPAPSYVNGAQGTR